ncbi:9084_t:CDS:2 [Rhizophagus irregularis]|nr:9084_t:CDS:2 [Rhizophagus irregularis]
MYGNDDFTIPGNMSTSQSTQSTQNTATTSFTSTSDVFEPGELKRYRNYWWKTGQMHSKARWEEATLPYELATEVPFDTYVERTDKYNIHGWWEWENGTVRVIELPTKFHERCVGSIIDEIAIAMRSVRGTNLGMLNDGSTTTKTRRTGKESDNAWTPSAKPRLIRGGCDRNGTQPWPNLVIEIAYTQSEADVKRKVETYWLQAGRAHDAIAIKIEEPVAPATRPSVMTAWHYCINHPRTATGAFNPTMYEFGTINRNGAQIQLQPGQCVINIQLACLYHGISILCASNEENLVREFKIHSNAIKVFHKDCIFFIL